MKTKEDYPFVLTSIDLSEILGISRIKAYELMESKGFPLLRIGRHKKVSRDAFFQWLNGSHEENNKRSI